MQVDPVSISTDVAVKARAMQVDNREVKVNKPATETVQKPEKKIDRDENIARLQSSLAEHNISLRFRTDPRTNRIIVNLVNEITGESVLQIPSEVSVKLAADFIDLQRNFLDQSN